MESNRTSADREVRKPHGSLKKKDLFPLEKSRTDLKSNLEHCPDPLGHSSCGFSTLVWWNSKRLRSHQAGFGRWKKEVKFLASQLQPQNQGILPTFEMQNDNAYINTVVLSSSHRLCHQIKSPQLRENTALDFYSVKEFICKNSSDFKIFLSQ